MLHIERSADLNLVREMFAEYGRSTGLDLDFQQFSEELATLPAGYDPILLGIWDGAVAACVALHDRGDGICEMKLGFLDIAPYRFNPIEGSRYMELALK